MVLLGRCRLRGERPGSGYFLALMRRVGGDTGQHTEHDDEGNGSGSRAPRLSMQADVFAVEFVFRPAHQGRSDIQQCAAE